MRVINCAGGPYEIGFAHGSDAETEIGRSIDFYAAHFKRVCKLDWKEVQTLAQSYEANIRQRWPEYVEEMQGIAKGSGRDLVDILALNVRTELAFGMFSDGCTALSWLTCDASYLGQNWDWELPQQDNLILLTITQPPKPTIKMVTEAGIIGKIGLNSAGVGVCLNAIRARGVDASRIPCHLGLRLVLDSESRDAAVAALSRTGVASSCHMLVADATGSAGLEWSSRDLQVLGIDGKGRILHTNHYLREHEGVQETVLLAGDTRERVGRLKEVLDQVGDNPGFEDVQGLFKDEKGYPASICRGPEDPHAATLFNIVMDLKRKKAVVVLGKPSQPDGKFELGFEEAESGTSINIQ